MKNILVLFLIVAITVLGQELNSADAQQNQPPSQAHPGGSEDPEGAIIILVSYLIALGIDCSFQINLNELQKFVGMQGFKIEDFLPDGKFSDQMQEQINSARELIRNKGCKVTRDTILNDFPNMGK